MTSQHKDLTSQHKDLTRRHKDLTSRHNYLTSDGRNMPPQSSDTLREQTFNLSRFRGLYPTAQQNTVSIQGSEIMKACISFEEKRCSGSNSKVCYSVGLFTSEKAVLVLFTFLWPHYKKTQIQVQFSISLKSV